MVSQWDGLTTDDTAQVTVLGATNRPFDVDKAILRRMPRAFLFDLPDEKERLSILTVILKGHRVADDLKLSELAARTQGYSGAFLRSLATVFARFIACHCVAGSDLKELCKHAALTPVREVIRRHREKTAGSSMHRTCALLWWLTGVVCREPPRRGEAAPAGDAGLPRFDEPRAAQWRGFGAVPKRFRSTHVRLSQPLPRVASSV